MGHVASTRQAKANFATFDPLASQVKLISRDIDQTCLEQLRGYFCVSIQASGTLSISILLSQIADFPYSNSC